MALEGAPEVGYETPTMKASQVIFGAENLAYQLEQFIKSGGHSVKILLSGKTGVGKSHLTNALIGEELAEEGEDVDPQTDKVTAYDFLKNNVNVTVFDTPGLADATGNDEEYLKKMKEDVSDLNLFLFCTEMNTKRFRNDDLETIKKLTMTFGPELWDHAVVVLTFANEVPLSPSSKTKDMSEKDIFVNRISSFKRKIKNALIQVGVPEAAASNVPFVPAGYLDEPRLQDRENWLTAFWVAAFRRINRNAKAAFLLANADRITFSSLPPSSKENTESEENADNLDPPSVGLSSEEVKAIKEKKKKLKEVFFQNTLERSLQKRRAEVELEDRITFSSLPPSSEENTESEENADNLDPPSAGLSSEEVKAIKEMKKKLKEVSFQNILERSLQKRRAEDELEEKSVTPQNFDQAAKGSETSSHDLKEEMIEDVEEKSVTPQNFDKGAKGSETSSHDLKEEMIGDVEEKSVTSQNQVAKMSGPFINVDETSSHDIIKEMIGEVTGQFVGDLTNKKFGRYYQTFLKWLMRRFKKLFPAVRAIKDKPENEKNEDSGEKTESETEDE